MRLAMLTTSWPTEGRSWAGHFISDLGLQLQDAGLSVEVLAVVPHGHRALHPPGLSIHEIPTSASTSPLIDQPHVFPETLARLASTARTIARQRRVDLWLAHWWPVAWATVGIGPTAAVLHGSDVDAYERVAGCARQAMTPPLVGRLAVAPHLAVRARRMDHSSPVVHCALGASPDAPALNRDIFQRLPALRRWLESTKPRVLTVGRDVFSKGLDVAQHAATRCDDVSWLVVSSADGVGPSGIRALLAHTRLLVVPTRYTGEGGEGRPHIITQALALGVPFLGGPNLVLTSLARELGQFEVSADGPEALAAAVNRALGTGYNAARRRAEREGEGLSWEAVLPDWLAAIERLSSAPVTHDLVR